MASRTQLRDACTASSYSLTLLLQGYKFNHTTWPNIHFVQQVRECPAAPSFTLCARRCLVPTLLLLGTGDTRAARPHCPYPGQLLSCTHAAAGTPGLAFVLSPSLCHCWGLRSPRWAQKWWLWSRTWGCRLFSSLPGTWQPLPSLFPLCLRRLLTQMWAGLWATCSISPT